MRTLFTALLSVVAVVTFQTRALLQEPSKVSSSLAAEAQNGPVRVIVHLDVGLGAAQDRAMVAAGRAALAAAQDEALLALPGLAEAPVRFERLPAFAVTTDLPGLRRLAELPSVVGIERDVVLKPSLFTSAELVRANKLWEQGSEGQGWSIAVLDSGVERTHSFLAGRLVAEGCFSTTTPALNATSLCPGGVSETTTPGSGGNCLSSISGCEHGTHVAGIALGRFQTLSGIARRANLISLQVFHRISGNSTSVGAFTSDVLRALQHVETLAGSGNAARIAAVNLSLGSGSSPGSCDSFIPTYTQAIENLRTLGIPTVVAAGNDGLTNDISFPACISRAISVGASNDNTVASFSNRASFLNLMAPGQNILSSLLGDTFGRLNGTSMAAPHVAGAWALLKSRAPSASVDTILTALSRTGTPIVDSSTGFVYPRITLDRAAGSLGPAGSPTSVITTVTGTELTVTWSPPFDGAPPTSYRVEIVSSLTGQTAFINVGAALSLLTTLPNGPYVVRVRSLDTGIASNDVPFTIGPLLRSEPPMAPMGARADIDGQRVSLSWNMPFESAPATSYIIEAGSIPGATNFGVFDTGTNALSIVVNNVQPGTYYVRIKARNAYGISPASNELTISVGGSGCTVPLTPTGLNVTVVGSQVTLNWNPPAVAGTVTGYLVEVGSSPGLANIASLPTGPATVVTAAAPSGVYYVRVRAQSVCGLTGPSNEVVVVVP